MKKFYSTRDAVSFLAESGIKTTVNTLNTWRCQGAGPAHQKILGKVYYTPESLAEYFKANGEVLK